MNRNASESSESSSTKDEGSFLGRMGGIPVVKSAMSQATFTYHKAKESNAVAMLSLTFAELSIKAAVKTTKFAYNVVPKPGFVGTLTDEMEKKVTQADTLACKALDVLQETFPYIINTDTKEILSDGAETLEQSEMLEAALIVSETAIDYISPSIISCKTEVNGNAQPTAVSNKKVDRVIDVSRRTGMVLYKGGSKALWGVASVPWYATKAGYNMITGAAQMTGDIMSRIPGLSSFVPARRKLRRSNRRRIKTKPEDIYTISPPASPDKKRKRSDRDSDSDNGKLYEILYVEQPSYDSNDDPDYCPDDDVDDDDDDDDQQGSDTDGSESGSSDTVGASDEEGDSGEGDEAEASTVGGTSYTPEEISQTRSENLRRGQDARDARGTTVVTEENKDAPEIMVRENEKTKEVTFSEDIALGGEVAKAAAPTKVEKAKEEKSKFKSEAERKIKSPKAKSVAASVAGPSENGTATNSPGEKAKEEKSKLKSDAERKIKSPKAKSVAASVAGTSENGTATNSPGEKAKEEKSKFKSDAERKIKSPKAKSFAESVAGPSEKTKNASTSPGIAKTAGLKVGTKAQVKPEDKPLLEKDSKDKPGVVAAVSSKKR